MKLTTENSNTTTKWRAPCIVHYIHDREPFTTQLVYAIGCLPLLPCLHRVKPANSAGKKCTALLLTLVQSELKLPVEWAGLPGLIDVYSIKEFSKKTFFFNDEIIQVKLCNEPSPSPRVTQAVPPSPQGSSATSPS